MESMSYRDTSSNGIVSSDKSNGDNVVPSGSSTSPSTTTRPFTPQEVESPHRRRSSSVGAFSHTYGGPCVPLVSACLFYEPYRGVQLNARLTSAQTARISYTRTIGALISPALTLTTALHTRLDSKTYSMADTRLGLSLTMDN
jgi:hypothetical protein